MCVDVRGVEIGRRTTLRPDDRSGPGLVSVRGPDWPGSRHNTKGMSYVRQTYRYAARHAERRFATRRSMSRGLPKLEGRRGTEARGQTYRSWPREGGQGGGGDAGLAARRADRTVLFAQAYRGGREG